MEKYFDAKNTILYMGLYLLFYLFKNGVGIFLLSKSKNDYLKAFFAGFYKIVGLSYRFIHGKSNYYVRMSPRVKLNI